MQNLSVYITNTNSQPPNPHFQPPSPPPLPPPPPPSPSPLPPPPPRQPPSHLATQNPELCYRLKRQAQKILILDQISTKTQNPKCRL
jgi:hypothetical protein